MFIYAFSGTFTPIPNKMSTIGITSRLDFFFLFIDLEKTSRTSSRYQESENVMTFLHNITLVDTYLSKMGLEMLHLDFFKLRYYFFVNSAAEHLVSTHNAFENL